MAGARKQADSHSATRPSGQAGHAAPAPKPHIDPGTPGYVTVTCGHCMTTYLAEGDGDGAFETQTNPHQCYGCCADHPNSLQGGK